MIQIVQIKIVFFFFTCISLKLVKLCIWTNWLNTIHHLKFKSNICFFGNLVFPWKLKLLQVVRILQIEYRHMNSIIFYYCYKNNIMLYINIVRNTLNRRDLVFCSHQSIHHEHYPSVFQTSTWPSNWQPHSCPHLSEVQGQKKSVIPDWLFPIYSWKALNGICMILSALSINSNYLQLIEFKLLNFLNHNNSWAITVIYS